TLLLLAARAVSLGQNFLGMKTRQRLVRAENTTIRMELMACAKWLKWAIEKEPWPDVNRIYIVTDLEFLANNQNNIQYWKRNGWRYRSGEPVGNDDLWDQILKSIVKLSRVNLRVDFHYKKGKKD